MKTRNVAIRIAVATSLALLWAGIGLAQEVTYNYDRTVDFSKYKTYKWVEIKGATYPNELQDKQIRQAIDAQLKTKGFSMLPTTTEKVDLFIGYQTSVQDEKSINGFGGGWGWGGVDATVTTINIGTLALDVYDPVAKSLVWRGTATKTLDPSSNPDKNQERLEKAMAKLLKSFPPPPPKK